MKTSSKFNKVINDAGKLALTEGHTVQSSSPRVSPCGLLSLKGEVMKTRKYYTLVALTTNEETQSVFWEIIFGDYDREVVEDERDDIENAEDVFHTSTFKIITTSDKQADIDLAVKCLNEKISEVQTWPWDTIILIPAEGGPLRICGTDIAVIYDREAKVYRRDPNPVKPSDELARF